MSLGFGTTARIGQLYPSGGLCDYEPQLMAPAGVLTFNAETHDNEGIILRDTLRYAHSAPYVRATLEAAGFSVVSLDSASTRHEKGIAVPGLVVVAQVPSS